MIIQFLVLAKMLSKRNVYNIFSILLLHIISTVCASEAGVTNNSEACLTPDNITGICIPIKNCSYIIDILSKKPVTEETKAKLRSYHCGSYGEPLKVCCPHKNIQLINQKFCGPKTGDKILGGTPSAPFLYPWAVLISYDTEIGKKWLCGGSLINENYVLTSAHCIRDLTQQLTIIDVRLGEYDTTKEIDCITYVVIDDDCAPPVQDIEVSEIIPHPKYDPITLDNNIGLLRLRKPVNFSESVQPICLPISSENKDLFHIDHIRHSFFMSGWGANNFAPQNTELNRNFYTVVSTEECQRNYSKIAPQIKIGNNQICLQEKGPESTVRPYCIGERGDSVHSFSRPFANRRYAQFGILSFGSKFCENVNQPKVLTKVSSYINWILDNIKP